MAKRKETKKPRTPTFGIGEWYGYDFINLAPERRREFALDNLKDKKERTKRPCPFRANSECTKEYGVCSLRLYKSDVEPNTGRSLGVPFEGDRGQLRATCPNRFYEDGRIFSWAGERLLGDARPLLISEVGFLNSVETLDGHADEDVGRIDMVLATRAEGDPAGLPWKYRVEWAALEIQAVYFSGNAMKGELKSLANERLASIPFPAGTRHPDYRSSGPKRLMPQLQIKVPTLRRWGKKMAVVVDRAFFDSLGKMDEVDDISNCDIAWFIVRFESDAGLERATLACDEVRLTTLERAVEGLTGGTPIALAEFERRVVQKIS